MKQFNLKSNTKMEKTPTTELFKLLDSKLKFWQDVWIATAASSNVTKTNVCTEWANTALNDYQSKFQNDIDLTLQISLRDSEIIDLKDKIDFQTNVINEQIELIKNLEILNADLKEYLNAKYNDVEKQISLRDSEIIDLKDKIIQQQMLIADLEESLMAKSIDGAKPLDSMLGI